MPAINTFGVQFFLRMNKLKDGKAPLYTRIVVNKKRCELALKRWLLVSDWNSIKGLAKTKTDHLKQVNTYLEQVRWKLVTHYQELQLQKKPITAEAIKNAFLGVREEGHSLLSLITYHNTQLKSVLQPGTLKNYFTTEKYIRKFILMKFKNTDIPLSELNHQFITEFEFYLRTCPPLEISNPLSNNGIMKHMERLRKAVTMAVKLEWLEKDPFERYQLKFQKTEIGYLTKEELERIETTVFLSARLNWARDAFVFSCYTGLAYIDMIQLQPKDILPGIDGNWKKLC